MSNSDKICFLQTSLVEEVLIIVIIVFISMLRLWSVFVPQCLSTTMLSHDKWLLETLMHSSMDIGDQL